MAETTNIILEFPESNLEIDLGEVITFDQISGFLPIERTSGNLPMERTEGDLAVDRLTGIGGLMSADEAHTIWNNL